MVKIKFTVKGLMVGLVFFQQNCNMYSLYPTVHVSLLVSSNSIATLMSNFVLALYLPVLNFHHFHSLQISSPIWN